jgi:hypothetical protein
MEATPSPSSPPSLRFQPDTFAPAQVDNAPSQTLDPDIEFRGWRERYYAGLPSHPRCVATTQSLSTWPQQSSTDITYPSKKYIAPPPRGHPLLAVWPTVAPNICNELDRVSSGSACVDVVRICQVGVEEEKGPVIIWLGCAPGAISDEEGDILVRRCKGMVARDGVQDVEVELRETEVGYSAVGLKDPGQLSQDHLAVCELGIPFANCLGKRISSSRVPHKEGTSGVCLRDPKTNRFFLTTAHHVIGAIDEDVYSDSPTQIRLFDENSFPRHMDKIHGRISQLEREIAEMNGVAGVSSCDLERTEAEFALLIRVRDEALRDHGTPSQRCVGNVFASPAIPTGTSADEATFTRDWALVEVDTSEGPMWRKHNRLSFRHSTQRDSAAAYAIKPTLHGSARVELRVESVVTRRALLGDELAVLMYGAVTGLSLGQVTEYSSYDRVYDFTTGVRTWSKQLAVVSAHLRTNVSACFSTNGDSGATVISRDGRVCALLTGGSGIGAGKDITYCTPFYHVLESIKDVTGMELELA